MSKRVAILTGGGDVPGLNICLKSLVYQVIDLGFEPLGVRKGWEGLLNYNPQDPSTFSQHFIELTKNRIRAIDQTSGSYLHSSRLDPRQTPVALLPAFLKEGAERSVDLTPHLLSVFAHLGLKAIIVLGDDDMLRYACHLSKQGLPIIAIPKTIHNNINGTDYTLGFSTGLARGVDFVHQLRALAGSREQVVVLETFGDRSGYSALLMAYLSGVDRALIPEVPYDPLRLTYLVQQDKQMTPSNYAIVTVTNGATIMKEKLSTVEDHLSLHSYAAVVGRDQEEFSPESSSTSSGIIVKELLQNLTGEEVFFQQLTYLMRTGAPDGQDLLGAANFAVTAANLLKEERYGRMAAFQQSKMWTDIDLAVAANGEKTVNVDAWYDVEHYRPTQGLIWAAKR